MDLYATNILSYIRVALDQPTARAVAEHLLRGAFEAQTGNGPKGCLGVMSSVAPGDEAEPIRADIIARRKAAQDALVLRFERAKSEGDLAEDVDVEGLTSCLFALVQGMAVQADGARLGTAGSDKPQILAESLAIPGS
jgi:hypothetical protein